MPTSKDAGERSSRVRPEIVVLHFQGCPATPTTVELIREVVQEERLAAKVSAREVRSHEQARRLRFLGSPTIQLEGRDLFPASPGARYGFYFRVYNNEGITMSWPSKEAIREALRTRIGQASPKAGEGWPRRHKP